MSTVIYIIGLFISAICLVLLLAPFWFFVSHHMGIHGDRKLTAKAIATDWDLWQKHVNIFSRDAWETSPIDERIKLAEQALRLPGKAHDPLNPAEH